MYGEELWGRPGWFGAGREDRERAEDGEAREVRAEMTDTAERGGKIEERVSKFIGEIKPREPTSRVKSLGEKPADFRSAISEE